MYGHSIMCTYGRATYDNRASTTSHIRVWGQITSTPNHELCSNVIAYTGCLRVPEVFDRMCKIGDYVTNHNTCGKSHYCLPCVCMHICKYDNILTIILPVSACSPPVRAIMMKIAQCVALLLVTGMMCTCITTTAASYLPAEYREEVDRPAVIKELFIPISYSCMHLL